MKRKMGLETDVNVCARFWGKQAEKAVPLIAKAIEKGTKKKLVGKGLEGVGDCLGTLGVVDQRDVGNCCYGS